MAARAMRLASGRRFLLATSGGHHREALSPHPCCARTVAGRRGPALASAATFYVHPSGGNDTKAIQKAFDAAVKAGPGSTVQLSAGHFYTNTILVRNFAGYFKGAGEGQTVIDTPRALDPTAPAVNDPSFATTAFEPFAFLFGFSGGNVRVSGMSVDITADAPADPWSAHEEIGATNIQDIFLITGSANSSFDQIDFTGAGSDTQHRLQRRLRHRHPGQHPLRREPGR